MRLLLDTHAFLWFIDGNLRLRDSVRQQIENPNNERHLSIAGLREIAIRLSIGKLSLSVTYDSLIPSNSPVTIFVCSG